MSYHLISVENWGSSKLNVEIQVPFCLENALEQRCSNTASTNHMGYWALDLLKGGTYTTDFENSIKIKI